MLINCMEKHSDEIILPKEFKDRIHIEFGDDGETWLRAFPGLLSDCIRQWQLKDLKLSPYLSYNAVMTGTSSLYGEIVLKMSVPHREFFSECNYILYHQQSEPKHPGTVVRRCLAYSPENHSMLLEWISPGNELWTITGLQERFKTGIGILAASPVPYKEGFSVHTPYSDGFPSYNEWMDGAYEKARKAGRGSAFLHDCWEDSYRFLSDVENESDGRMLLHGDLHHSNMLFDRKLGWQIIDPKGVIGVKPMECGRFIRNQLSDIEKNAGSGRMETKGVTAEKKRQLGILTDACAEAFGTAALTILKCCFVDAALSNCWYLEGEIPPDLLDDRTLSAERECRFFLEQLHSF